MDGGTTPLGYRVIDKKLLLYETDAETVRTIFRLYLEVDNVRCLVLKLDELGIRTRPRSAEANSRPGGCAFGRGALYTILSNPNYIGKCRHRDQIHEGQHEGIIDIDLWEAVQTKLKAHAAALRRREKATSVALLRNKLTDGEGRRLVVSNTTKRGRRYRYYITEGLDRKAVINGWRLPGRAIEDLIYAQCQSMLSDAALITRSTHEAGIAQDQLPGILQRLRQASKSLGQTDMLTQLVEAVGISTDMLTITLKLDSLIATETSGNKLTLTETMPVQLRRRFNEMRLVITTADQRTADVDAVLVRTIARGHVWFDEWLSGKVTSLKDIAAGEGVGQDHVADVVKLAFLSPDIVEAIIQGQQPPELSKRRLLKLSHLPTRWTDQVVDLDCV